MTTINSLVLQQAIDERGESRAKVAYGADVVPATLTRVLDGENVELDTIAKVADYLGYDTVVNFTRRPAKKGDK